MKSRSLFPTLCLSSLFALTAPLQITAQIQTSRQVRYTVTDLGTLGGPGTNSAALDINQAGWSAGSSNLIAGGPQHGFLSSGRGPLLDLGTLGGPNSAAGGPNASGEAALVSETLIDDPYGEDFCGFGSHLQCVAAIWKNGTLTALPLLRGGHNAQAYGLNNRGQVIGFSENGIYDPSCATATPSQVTRFEAVIWGPTGNVRQLRPLPGDSVTFGFGINDQGQAVGSSGSCSTQGLPPAAVNGKHAVLWEKDGSAKDLGNLGGTSSNVAGSINNRGDVSGTSQFIDGTVHAFIWTQRTGIRDLGTLPGAVFTVAPCCNAINDEDEVIGFSFDDLGNVTPFHWQNGVMKDLNNLLEKGSPWQLLFAEALNNAGEIVGQGLINGELHAFLAKPIESDSNERGCCDDWSTAFAAQIRTRPDRM